MTPLPSSTITVKPILVDEPESTKPANGYDSGFVHRLQQKDPAAFDQLVAEQSPVIQLLVTRLLGWDPACDDVVQEVFISAWERIDRFQGDSKLESWLYSIALNQCRKVRRRQGRWATVFRRLCHRHIQVVDYEHESESGDRDQSELISDVYWAINQLSQPERELIVLVSIEGKSMDQSSEILGVRKNTLEVRLHRARKRLKQMIGERRKSIVK